MLYMEGECDGLSSSEYSGSYTHLVSQVEANPPSCMNCVRGNPTSESGYRSLREPHSSFKPVFEVHRPEMLGRVAGLDRLGASVWRGHQSMS